MARDLEKQAIQVGAGSTSDKEGVIVANDTAVPSAPHVPVPSKLRALNNRIEGLDGLEARGIARVPPEERHDISPLRYAQVAVIWYSANISANNLAVGLLGPLVFHLGFVDSVMMAVWGCLLGSMITAYMSIWGAQSGNRTMVSIKGPPAGAAGDKGWFNAANRLSPDTSWDTGQQN
jgi:Permease for cytosine/purines, uracil, thiamine, allantoin